MNTGTGWPQDNNPKIPVEFGTLVELWEMGMIADHKGLLGNCIIETDGPYVGFCKACSVLEEILIILESYGYKIPDWI